MKHLFAALMLFVSALAMAQEMTGSIIGVITDKEMNNDPLPFANVQIQGSSKGTTTDIDGLYEISNVEPGTYTIVVSFIGYETLKVPDVVVEAGKVTEINTGLGAGSVSLDEVVVTTTVRRDSETALLLDQKKAVEIKESIGAQQLSKLGVSDVATATTKISGVTSSEASGDVYVRGLGDRYLSTTMNGLPVPSDDVERKNIDLSLFPTRVIQNVGISKTYSTQSSADQASGNIDIATRELAGSEEFSIGIRGGANTNVMQSGVSDNFKVSPNTSDVTMGFYKKDIHTYNALVDQTWNTQTADNPMNYRYAITAGKKIGEKLSLFFTGSQSTSHEYKEGVFREYRSNFINDSITDAVNYSKNITTTGLLDVGYFINSNSKVKFHSLFVNKLSDEVYEGGRNGEGWAFEETETAEGLSQFIRDQNIKQTRLWINQLVGTHFISEKNQLDWAVGYNMVDADEPNRIRNEVNFDIDSDFVQLGRTGGFQQRKSSQEISDREINGLIKDKLVFIDEEEKQFNINVGANFRNKTRDFESNFYGLEEASTNTLNPTSIDDISSVFTRENWNNGTLTENILPTDYYDGELSSIAGFVNFSIGIKNFIANVGFRYEVDDLDVNFDVNNYPGREGTSSKSYSDVYPSLNMKYNFNEKHGIRFATSRTITLPEFKEMAPFEYVSPTGQVTRGNPNIEASTNYNYDLKYEYFITPGQLVSFAGFYKTIEDPINKVQDRGSAGVFSYFNSGEEARIFGLELETRLDLVKSEEVDSGYDLNLNLNATRMWHQQDLKEMHDEEGNFIRTFRYKGLTETGLQGASEWIFNSSLSFSTKQENEFNATVTANYASDKIFAIGAPEIQTESDINYNDEIIEEGFVVLDAVLSKDFGEHWSFRLMGRNLLNPDVKRTQNVKPSTTGIETNRVVRSYTNGVRLSLGVNYSF
ncbi:TonB-dependent receptor [Galbibacter sp. EGI 63066]|uniref:TonB-dependent receptor n=1 Tax=Galbibacter sp. EGI 63066 TaxID=2993559 RepID=UPI0022488BFF|nr:TonB-dependent receptor [Galbibacter sp. EGI 63066]MCX2679883.1 TonB-dependent receptor [Galbibacter sp. EGI 63066]